MTTEYEVSTTLVFWGDSLDSETLGADMGHNDVQSTRKGEPLKFPDGRQSGSTAKTGRLSCDFALQGKARRDPEAQITHIGRALERLDGSIAKTYGVGKAELQMSFYYKEKVRGEPDFLFLPKLLELLVRHQIGLRITILP